MPRKQTPTKLTTIKETGIMNEIKKSEELLKEAQKVSQEQQTQVNAGTQNEVPRNQVREQIMGNVVNPEKINFLIDDEKINAVECVGPGKPVLARTFEGVKTTNVSLNEKEIGEIINRFSEQSKIPVEEGTFKAVVGNLMITAVVSDLVGSRFIITKTNIPEI